MSFSRQESLTGVNSNAIVSFSRQESLTGLISTSTMSAAGDITRKSLEVQVGMLKPPPTDESIHTTERLTGLSGKGNKEVLVSTVYLEESAGAHAVAVPETDNSPRVVGGADFAQDVTEKLAGNVPPASGDLVEGDELPTVVKRMEAAAGDRSPVGALLGLRHEGHATSGNSLRYEGHATSGNMPPRDEEVLLELASPKVRCMCGLRVNTRDSVVSVVGSGAHVA